MRVPSPLRIVACAALLSTSCTFPEVTFDATAGGGSGGATGTSTGTAGSGAGGGNGGSGAGAGGGTTNTSSTGDGGSGGVGGGGSGGVGGGGTTTSSSGGSGGSTCAEDFDADTFIAWCAGGPDCADEDPTAHPGAGFDSAPIVGETKPNTDPFDRDCNGAVLRETSVLDCSGIVICGNAQGYKAAVPCGQYGVLGKCAAQFPSGCKWTALNPMVEKQQKCK